MKLPGYAILLVLTVLFLIGIATRLANDGDESPYFEGPSAMNYRHATLVADGDRIDVQTHKSNFPEGYTPARYRPHGLEIIVGHALRAGRFLGVTDGVGFVRRFAVILFCLCVFTMYVLARRLWNCQGAGLMGAFLVAVLVPLASATNGSFDHAAPAAFLITVHVVLLLRPWRPRVSLAVATVIALCLLAVWEGAIYYVSLSTAVVALLSPRRSTRWTVVVVAHGAVMIVGAIAVPYLAALRAFASWPVALAAACAVYRVVARGPEGWRAATLIAVGTVVLTIILTPVRAAAEMQVSVLQTIAYRLRFLSGKPISSESLPNTVRYLWPTPITGHTTIRLFLPLAALAIAGGIAGRPRWHTQRTQIVLAAIAGLVGLVTGVLDRDLLPIAVVAMIPAAAFSVIDIAQGSRVRTGFAIAGAYLVLAEVVFPLGAINPSFFIARRARVAYRDPYTFLRVSLENTDQEMLRFVATRTSVKDPILGRPEHTALLLAFAGRTAVLPEGAISDDAANKEVLMLQAMYGDVNVLHAVCVDAGITHVLYSVDLLLDTTVYSKRYLAGIPSPSPESAVFRMHFYAEQLRGFTLVYENEHYRIFKVTDSPQPIFITDHPPVYQRDIFDRAGRDVDAFRQRVIELTATYTDALRTSARGDMQGALKKLGWCLSEAPRFTLARIGVASTLAQMGQLEDARKTLMAVLGYAPDNQQALYQTAYVLARLEDTEGARKFLDLLFTSGTDKEIIERARLLESFIDEGISVGPGMLPQ